MKRALFALSTLASLTMTMTAATTRADSGSDAPIGPPSLSTPELTGQASNVFQQMQVTPATGQLANLLTIDAPAARGRVHPALSLAYSSAAGDGAAGRGWSLDLPVVERRSPSGRAATPTYTSSDRFVYDGRPLVPICVVQANGTCTGESAAIPPWLSGWTYFREESDHQFLRFFQSSTGRTWLVEDRSGETIELGAPLDNTGDSEALDSDASGIFRWNVIRRYDTEGATFGSPQLAPVNVARYRWQNIVGPRGYLTDVFDTPPANSPSTATSAYAHHVQIAYAPPTYKLSQNSTPLWRAIPLTLISTISVNVSPWGSTSPAKVKQYTFTYQYTHGHALLTEVVEQTPNLTPNDWSFTYGATTESPETYTFSGPIPPGPDGNDPFATVSVADINADGLPDFVHATHDTTKPEDVYYNALTTTTSAHGRNALTQETLGDTPEPLLFLDNRWLYGPRPPNANAHALTIVGDWLNDAAMDALWTDGQNVGVFSAPGGQWLWPSSQSSLTSAPCQWEPLVQSQTQGPFVTDVNGDGLSDLVLFSQAEVNSQNVTTQGIQLECITKEDPDGTIHPLGQVCKGASGCSSVIPSKLFSITNALADMNGDSLPDAVTFDSDGTNSLQWTSGDGDSGIMGLPTPFDLSNDLYYLHDVNGDGFADLIWIEAQTQGGAQIRVALNQNGASFDSGQVLSVDASRVSTGADSNLWSAVTFADMNGNGTDDIVILQPYIAPQYVEMYGAYVDNQGTSAPPYALTGTDNNKGATTAISYASSSTLATQAAAAGQPWLAASVGGSPQPFNVVTSVVVQNGATMQQAQQIETDYAYRDLFFDQRERANAVFQTVTQSSPSPDQPTVQTTFHVGISCGRDAEAPGLPCISDALNRPLRGLRGLPELVNVFDSHGAYLKTEHYSYLVPRWYTGLDGRTVHATLQTQQDTYLYDTSHQPSSQGYGDTQPGVVVTPENLFTALATETYVLSGTIYNQIETTFGYDSVGNLNDTLEKGNLGSDAPIHSTAHWSVAANDATGWEWRMDHQHVDGATGALPRDETLVYDTLGHLTTVQATLAGSVLVTRANKMQTAGQPSNAAGSGTVQAVSISYDEWGHPNFYVYPNGQCTLAQYDGTYGLFPQYGYVFAGTPNAFFGCGGTILRTTAVYDPVSGLPVLVVDPSLETTSIERDDVGRPLKIYRPDPNNPGTPDAQPDLTFVYQDVWGGPFQLVHGTSYQQSGAVISESWYYFDSLGRFVAQLHSADPAVDNAAWIVTGLNEMEYASGKIYGTWPAFRLQQSVDPTQFDGGGDGEPAYIQYDTFGRPVVAFDSDINSTAVSLYAYHGLTTWLYDANAIQGTKATGAYSSRTVDGFGRVVQTTQPFHTNGQAETLTTTATYAPTGELLTQNRSYSGASTSRSFTYDSLGRMVQSQEPNSGTNTYAYDQAGDLVGTGDARGCGENIFYDAAGRKIAADYSPCSRDQAPYSRLAPDFMQTGVGTEEFYVYDAPEPGAILEQSAVSSMGRLAARLDRASHAQFEYDGRGRILGVAKQVAQPGTPDPNPTSRYAPWWYTRSREFDNADRVTIDGTGADIPELLGPPAGKYHDHTPSILSITYGVRGLVQSVSSTYGTLLAGASYQANGNPLTMTFGDVAGTTAQFTYDTRNRAQSYTVSRGAPSLWSQPTGLYSPPSPSACPGTTTAPCTLQLGLVSYQFSYDAVGNPTSVVDGRTPSEWPAGAQPASRSMQYDDLYRLTGVAYTYPQSSPDSFAQPWAPEENAGSVFPLPGVGLNSRPASQSFSYDGFSNISSSTDDQNAFFDRSPGTPSAYANGPNQVAQTAVGAGADAGQASLTYDAAGNTTRVQLARQGNCADGPSGPGCSVTIDLFWDEIGNLSEVRRFDGDSPACIHPSECAGTVDEQFAYDAGGARVLRGVYVLGSQPVFDVDIFSTLRLRGARFFGDYERSAETEEVRLIAAGVLYGRADARVAGLPTVAGNNYKAYLAIPNYNGSTAVDIDLETSEVVEALSYQPFGAVDSDMRSPRWNQQYDEFRYDGQFEEAAFGLVYYGHRYMMPGLARWMSPDPLWVRTGTGDPNPYGVNAESPFGFADPDGLNANGSDGCLGSEQCTPSGNGDDDLGDGYNDGYGSSSGGGGGGGGSGGFAGYPTFGPGSRGGVVILRPITAPHAIASCDTFNGACGSQLGPNYWIGPNDSLRWNPYSTSSVATALLGTSAGSLTLAQTNPELARFLTQATQFTLGLLPGVGQYIAIATVLDDHAGTTTRLVSGVAVIAAVIPFGGQLGELAGALAESGGFVADAAEELPTLVISRARMPQIAENIENALGAGRPDVLTRGAGKVAADANRAAALEAVEGVQFPAGSSVDEYPFASVVEGGEGSWLGQVPMSEQRIQGGVINGFFSKNKLPVGGRFRVVVGD